MTAAIRALLEPGGPDPDTDAGLHERYRPPRASWVRANFITSADGAVALAGRSGGLGNEADRRVFATVRDHADVVLVGAGTVRVEGYGPLDPPPERRARRRADGRADAPRLAVVGRPTSVTGAERWITGAGAPPLLLTTTDELRVVPGCETVDCGPPPLAIVAALDALVVRGLVSVVCEGGPTLFTALAASGRLDELCLSYSPVLAGPGEARIVTGVPWPTPLPGRLTGLLEADSLLLCRYALG